MQGVDEALRCVCVGEMLEEDDDDGLERCMQRFLNAILAADKRCQGSDCPPNGPTRFHETGLQQKAQALFSVQSQSALERNLS